MPQPWLLSTCLLAAHAFGATPDAAVTVYDDDARYREMLTQHETWEKAYRDSWDELHLEELRKSGRLTSNAAGAIARLPDAEKAALRDWLQTHPLKDDTMQKAALYLAGAPDVRAEMDEAIASTDTDTVQINWPVIFKIAWDQDNTLVRVTPLLLRNLDHPDDKIVRQSIFLLRYVDADIWADAIEDRLRQPDYPFKPNLLFLIRESDRQAKFLDLVAAQAAHAPVTSCLYYYSDIIDETQGDVQAKARALFWKTIDGQPPEIIRDNTYRLLQHFPEKSRPLILQMLEAVAAEDIEPKYSTAYALQKWAYADPDRAREQLEAWFDNPALGRDASYTLGVLARGTRDTGLAQRLYDAEMASDEPNAEVAHIIGAIEGEEAERLAVELLRQAKPGSYSLGDRWTIMGVSVNDALQGSVRHGLIDTAPDLSVLDENLAEYGTTTDPFSQWYSALDAAGAIAYFDVETDTFPNRHDLLILEELGQAGRGIFTPTRAVEVWRDDRDGYDVLFEYRGKWYGYFAENHGDWYDLKSTLNAVNFALADNGRRERFLALPDLGQCAGIILPDPDQAQAFSKEFGIPFGTDPEAARKSGQEYEALVEQRLGLKESEVLP